MAAGQTIQQAATVAAKSIDVPYTFASTRSTWCDAKTFSLDAHLITFNATTACDASNENANDATLYVERCNVSSVQTNDVNATENQFPELTARSKHRRICVRESICIDAYAAGTVKPFSFALHKHDVNQYILHIFFLYIFCFEFRLE